MSSRDFPAHYEERMQSGIYAIFINIILSIAIFYGAEIGQTFGIKGGPLAISLIWPPTGFSLGALLLFGNKVWPGIFLGNFAYNFYHLSLASAHLPIPLITAILITSGSVFQALLAKMILSNFTTKGYFNSLYDVLVFLFPAGLFTCWVASTVGVIALSFFYQDTTLQNLFKLWFTFWIGDSMGVYVFTPLLVIWATSYRNIQVTAKGMRDALLMVVLAFVIVVCTVRFEHPLIHLFIPLCMWVAYRFYMLGATIAIFFVAVFVIIASFYGVNPYTSETMRNPLLVLVVFLEILVGTTLVFAAFVNEYLAAWRQIENHNIDLQRAVEMYRNEMEHDKYTYLLRERVMALGLLTSGIVKLSQMFQGQVSLLIASCIKQLSYLRQSVRDQAGPQMALKFDAGFDSLHDSFSKVQNYEVEINKINNYIEEHAALSSSTKINKKSININTLLDNCLANAIKESKDTIVVHREFDKGIPLFLVYTDALAHAFFHFFMHSISLMKDKAAVTDGYKPVLHIKTYNDHQYTVIEIKDNGIGVPADKIRTYLAITTSVQPENLSKEMKKFSLVIASDIIKYVYHGAVNVDSKENEYLRVTIKIPDVQ